MSDRLVDLDTGSTFVTENLTDSIYTTIVTQIYQLFFTIKILLMEFAAVDTRHRALHSYRVAPTGM